MKKERAGVVIMNEKNEILIIHRFRDGKEYYVFPGGGVEDGETTEQAAIREASEELSLAVTLGSPLITLTNEDRKEVYYLVRQFDGEALLGGEEKERMNESNQYHLEWMDKHKLANAEPLYPAEVKQKALLLFTDEGK